MLLSEDCSSMFRGGGGSQKEGDRRFWTRNCRRGLRQGGPSIPRARLVLRTEEVASRRMDQISAGQRYAITSQELACVAVDVEERKFRQGRLRRRGSQAHRSDLTSGCWRMSAGTAAGAHDLTFLPNCLSVQTSSAPSVFLIASPRSAV
jgi:hypothetical protein